MLIAARTTTTTDDAKLNQPLAQQSCATFGFSFLIPIADQCTSKMLREPQAVARSSAGHLTAANSNAELCEKQLGFGGVLVFCNGVSVSQLDKSTGN